MFENLGPASFLFYSFAIALIYSSLTVVFSRKPVTAVMSLIFSFILAAILWIFTQAEFLGLLLIFVYVGAVMTLFLFVVMMINLNTFPTNQAVPWGLLFVIIPAALLIYAANETFYLVFKPSPDLVLTMENNVQQLGAVLYTNLSVEFHICGLLLLIAAIGGVSLCHINIQPSSRGKRQTISEQIDASNEQRIQLIDLRENDD
mgnify:CR=1 FL=1